MQTIFSRDTGEWVGTGHAQGARRESGFWMTDEKPAALALFPCTPADKYAQASDKGSAIRPPALRMYRAAWQARAVQLAIESEQPIAQTAHELGVTPHTLHTWIETFHRAEHHE